MLKEKKQTVNILAIETSCDETALSFVAASGGLERPQLEVYSDVVASQIKLHQPYGGVVPALAKRAHQEKLPVLLNEIVRQCIGLTDVVVHKEDILDSSYHNQHTSHVSTEACLRRNDKRDVNDDHIAEFMERVDLISVTVGPGLEPALWAGIAFANMLAETYRKPLIGTNHLAGHLYSFLVSKDMNSRFHGNDKKEKRDSKKKDDVDIAALFPAVALIVSGGHTILLRMDDLTRYKKLGETVDDAVGEAFDKVARLIDLPYPGGPEIEKLAQCGSGSAFDFPRPMIGHKNYNFSFSGLKTSVLYQLRDIQQAGKDIPKADVAASFQKAAFDVLIKKTMRAAEECNAKSVMISGGVSASNALRAAFSATIEKQFLPNARPKFIATEFATDNALMIAAAGYIDYLRNKTYTLEANGNLNL